MKLGVTGHQNIKEFDINWISSKIEFLLINQKITKGFTSLAIGSDQLFADLLLANGIQFEVIVPCKNYDLTFHETEQLLNYKRLLNHALKVYRLNFEEPNEQAFYQAGKKVVDFSEVLIAIWDGKKAKGLGGTGDIFAYAQENHKSIFHINPVNQTQVYLNAN